jgi:hypothetical protein
LIQKAVATSNEIEDRFGEHAAKLRRGSDATTRPVRTARAGC